MQQSKLGGNVNIKKITKYQWACVFDTNLHADGAHTKEAPRSLLSATLIRHLNTIQYSAGQSTAFQANPPNRVPESTASPGTQSDDLEPNLSPRWHSK